MEQEAIKASPYFYARLKKDGLEACAGALLKYAVLCRDVDYVGELVKLNREISELDLKSGSGKGRNMRLHKWIKTLIEKAPDYAPGMSMVLVGDGFGAADITVKDIEQLRSMKYVDATRALEADARVFCDEDAMGMLKDIRIKHASGKYPAQYQLFSALFEVWIKMKRRATLIMALQDAAVMFSSKHRYLTNRAAGLLRTVEAEAERRNINLKYILDHEYYGSEAWLKKLNSRNYSIDQLIDEEMKACDSRADECIRLIRKILNQ